MKIQALQFFKYTCSVVLFSFRNCHFLGIFIFQKISVTFIIFPVFSYIWEFTNSLIYYLWKFQISSLFSKIWYRYLFFRYIFPHSKIWKIPIYYSIRKYKNLGFNLSGINVFGTLFSIENFHFMGILIFLETSVQVIFFGVFTHSGIQKFGSSLFLWV